LRFRALKLVGLIVDDRGESQVRAWFCGLIQDHGRGSSWVSQKTDVVSASCVDSSTINPTSLRALTVSLIQILGLWNLSAPILCAGPSDPQASALEFRLPTLTMASSRGHDDTFVSGEVGFTWWTRPNAGILLQTGPAGNLGTSSGGGVSSRLAFITRQSFTLASGLEIETPMGLALRRWRVGVVEKIASAEADDYASAYKNARIGTIATLDLGLQWGFGMSWNSEWTTLRLMLAEFHFPAYVIQSSGRGLVGGRADRHARSADWSLLRVSITQTLN
jgi:hypothetical protein